jgi:ribosomal protein L40E
MRKNEYIFPNTGNIPGRLMTTETIDIRQPEKAPNHYEALGIRLFESDIGKIHEAGFKRFTEINNMLSESNTPGMNDSAQDFLNLLSLACTTLENPEKKKTYDQTLADELGVDLEEEVRRTYVNEKLDSNDLQLLKEAEEQQQQEQQEQQQPQTTTDSSRILKLSNNDILQLKDAGKQLNQVTIDQKSETAGPVLRLAKKKQPTTDDLPGRTQRIANFREHQPKLLGPQKTEVILFDEKNTNANAPQRNEAVLKQGNTTFSMFKCENCEALMSEWATICIECGYDKVRKKVTRTKTIKNSPPLIKIRTGPISRAFKAMLENIKKTVAALISFLLLALVSFACVMFILKITSKEKFIVDSNKTIVSSEWASNMRKSKLWETYFEHCRVMKENKPYVKLHLKTERKESTINTPQKLYSIKIEDMKNNEIIYEKSFAMDFNPNISEKIDEKSKIIKEIMDEAAEHAILKRAQKYPELLTGDWGDNTKGINGAINKLQKAID